MTILRHFKEFKASKILGTKTQIHGKYNIAQKIQIKGNLKTVMKIFSGALEIFNGSNICLGEILRSFCSTRSSFYFQNYIKLTRKLKRKGLLKSCKLIVVF